MAKNQPKDKERTQARTSEIVARVWKLCDILRDDGITYHQYVNELTYLLFLKMSAETGKESLLLKGCRWHDLIDLSQQASEQYARYLHLLDELGTRGKGRVRQIFANPTTFLHKPESLNRLVAEIDAINWHTIDTEHLGDIYEGILQKNASELKGGAGQYFTPRPLVDSIISVLQPSNGDLVFDPAAGTGGFLISAKAYLDSKNSEGRFRGTELVRDAHRLLLMNAMLHSIDGELTLGDSLSAGTRLVPFADVIATNPPFGNKRGNASSLGLEIPFPTSNKQLAFLQLVIASLKPGGKAAVVVPDNVLFEGGVGTKVRTCLMDSCELHTILRLPTGIFYAPGVKTNVLFFTRQTGRELCTSKVWFYDLRTGIPAFGKRSPLTRATFAEFESSIRTLQECEGNPVGTVLPERLRHYSREAIRDRGENLDITWMTERSNDADELDADDLYLQLREQLTIAIDELDALSTLIEPKDSGL